MSRDHGSDAPSHRDEQTARQILEFLRSEDYFIVQEAIISLESHTAKLQIEAFSNLRDVLDHLVRAAAAGAPAETADDHLAEAREHLRRAAVHPLQDQIDLRLKELDAIQKWYFIRRELAPEVPSPHEVRRRRGEAMDLLTEARLLKGDQTQTERAVVLLRETLDKLDTLLIDVRPPRRSVAFHWVFWVATVVFSVALGILIRSMF
jgi:hypothetical protein